MTRPIQQLLSLFLKRTQPSNFDEVVLRAGEKHEVTFHCQIPSYEQYETDYRKLALVMGAMDRTPDPAELQHVRHLLNRRTNAAGSLGFADCLFLAAFVSITRPRRMVETGTGGGFSSALLACIIQLQQQDLRALCIDTFDVQTTYFGDAKLPVGFEIRNLISEFPELVRVHAPGESTLVGTVVRPR